jgi:hypothetical protein
MIISHKFGEKWILIEYVDETRGATGRSPTVSFRSWDGDRWSGSTSTAHSFDTREDAEKYLADHRHEMTATG